jgi:hypothetical protein
MEAEVKRAVMEILPDQHPHFFLGHFKEPFETLSLAQAIAAVHQRIAAADHDELVRVSDKVTAYLAPKDSTIEELGNISLKLLGAMLSIRQSEFSAPCRN